MTDFLIDTLRAKRWEMLSRTNRMVAESPSAKSETGSALPLSISVVVLNLNGERVLSECLRCLLKQSLQPKEIIIFDNGSSDSSRTIAESFNSPLIRWMGASSNAGVAGGRNQACKTIAGDIIAFLDNDGYADENWLIEAQKVLLSNADIGAVSSLVFFKHSPLLINGAGGGTDQAFQTQDLLFKRDLKEVLAQSPWALDNPSVQYPMGCGTLIRREVWERIAPLDAMLPKWFDDVELGVRVGRLGYRVSVARLAVIDHDFQTSDKLINRRAWQRGLLFEKARIRHWLKYGTVGELGQLFTSDITAFCRRLAGGSPQQLIIYICAWVWNLFHLLSTLEIRRTWKIENRLAGK